MYLPVSITQRRISHIALQKDETFVTHFSNFLQIGKQELLNDPTLFFQYSLYKKVSSAHQLRRRLRWCWPLPNRSYLLHSRGVGGLSSRAMRVPESLCGQHNTTVMPPQRSNTGIRSTTTNYVEPSTQRPRLAVALATHAPRHYLHT